ncbi:MAG: two-component system, chemotaxis family, chemotaxis protein CheY [Clostridiales bacterium]|nr:two-component system, chemotaxis family, chemotaxis protein CheY [Clostridiales bacterium]
MKKVLIVDDSVFSQKMIAILLQKHIKALDIHFASDGEEGLRVYKEINPDWVFLDLLMPKLSGQALIPLIHAHDKAANIIVVSADVQNTVKEEVEASGIRMFLNKPFTEEKVQEVVSLIKESVHEG